MIEASRTTSTICVLDLQNDQRHVENGNGAPLCGTAADGALVVDDPADADCDACRLIAFGRLN